MWKIIALHHHKSHDYERRERARLQSAVEDFSKINFIFRLYHKLKIIPSAAEVLRR